MYRYMENSRGVTLVEMLIGMALGSIVLGGLYSFFSTTDRVFKTQNYVSELAQNMRSGFNLLSKELRMAGYNNGSPGSRFTNAFTRVVLDGNNNAVEITFVMDSDNGGVAGDISADFITYRLDEAGDTGYRDTDHRRLMRGTASVPANFIPVAENINSLTFLFFDGTGTSITATNAALSQAIRDTIRTVKITIGGGTEKADSLKGVYLTSVLNGMVSPRNLAY